MVAEACGLVVHDRLELGASQDEDRDELAVERRPGKAARSAG
jgi:hypothetical protein